MEEGSAFQEAKPECLGGPGFPAAFPADLPPGSPSDLVIFPKIPEAMVQIISTLSGSRPCKSLCSLSRKEGQEIWGSPFNWFLGSQQNKASAWGGALIPDNERCWIKCLEPPDLSGTKEACYFSFSFFLFFLLVWFKDLIHVQESQM